MTLIIGIVDITRVLYGNTEYWILNEFCCTYCMYNLVIGGAVANSFAPKDPQQELSFAVFLVNIFSLPGFLPILLLRTILARTELTLPASHLLTHGHNHTISFFWAECLYHCPPGTWVHLGSTPCKTHRDNLWNWYSLRATIEQSSSRPLLRILNSSQVYYYSS